MNDLPSLTMTKMASPSRILIFPLAAEPNAGLRISIKDYCRTPLLYLGRVPVSFVSATLFLLLWPLRDLKKITSRLTLSRFGVEIMT